MELTEDELKFLNKIRAYWSGFGVVSFSNSRELIRDLYWRAKYDPDTKEIAESILKKSRWDGIDNEFAYAEGWYLEGNNIFCRASGRRIFQTHDEAVEHIKNEAARGDVLAEKAIIEIARRKLNGSSKDVL